MPVITAAQARIHEYADNRWHSFISPSRGSSQLCAWRIDIPAGTLSSPHRVNREEVLYVLEGVLTTTINGHEQSAQAGDVVFVPAEATVRVDNRSEKTASMWVTTSTGFEATFEDGTTLVPEWVR